MRRLRRFVATWTDGKEMVLHCRDLVAAYDLARRLEPPAGVRLRDVSAVLS